MFREYLSMLAECNGLPPGEWRIEPGMGFGSDQMWWSGGWRRSTPHNGLDLRSYKMASGEVLYLDGTGVIPVAENGEIINIIRDFLGFSVFVSHEEDGSGVKFVSAYGHIVPGEGLETGAHLRRGDIIGKLSEYEDMPVPPHLHISLIEADAKAVSGLDWPQIENAGGRARGLRFLDPLGPDRTQQGPDG
jgi:hypothetical protein